MPLKFTLPSADATCLQTDTPCRVDRSTVVHEPVVNHAVDRIRLVGSQRRHRSEVRLQIRIGGEPAAGNNV